VIFVIANFRKVTRQDTLDTIMDEAPKLHLHVLAPIITSTV